MNGATGVIEGAAQVEDSAEVGRKDPHVSASTRAGKNAQRAFGGQRRNAHRVGDYRPAVDEGERALAEIAFATNGVVLIDQCPVIANACQAVAAEAERSAAA